MGHPWGAINKLHGGKARHIESVPVTELFNRQVVWDGVVEVFKLKGHPKTDKGGEPRGRIY